MPTKESDKFIESNIFEGMTSISALLNSDSNDRKINKILYNVHFRDKKPKQLAFLRHRASELDFELTEVSDSEIEKHTIGSSHGGVIAFCSERAIPSLSIENIAENGVYYMLEGIEDPYNFGYALRSIYASGADGVILSPRNWMGAAGVVARASAGASELLNLYISLPEDAIRLFKEKNYKVYAADKPNSVSIYDTDMKKPLFVIIGGEKRGNTKVVLDSSDKIIRIDYGRDFPAALSAASAATIISFEVYRQNNK